MEPRTNVTALHAVPPLSRDELVAELRAKENDLIEEAAGLLLIAETLWPVGDSERPAWLEEGGVCADDIVQGVASLHEYCNRLIDENYAMRAKLDGVPSAEQLPGGAK
jgi:hypothetical protein